MGFNDLKLDIILDIFSRYVASTQHGPFILSTICTSWRDFTLRTPRLWTFISIDEMQEDWQELFDIGIALSRNLPISITLKIPMSSVVFLRPHIRRIRSLRLHISDSMQQEEMIDRLCQLHTEDMTYTGCVEWYYTRPGDAYISPVDHSQYKPSEYYGSWRRDILKASTGPRGVFFTYFAPDRFFQYCDSGLVWRTLESLPNLARLRIRGRVLSSMKLIPDFNLYLPRLIELEILFERHGDRSSTFQALISRIQAPNLQVTKATALLGADLENSVNSLHQDLCPFHLHLHLSGLTFGQPERNSPLARLSRVTEVHLDLRNSSVTETVSKFLRMFIDRFPNLTACFISVDEPSYSIIPYLAGICPVFVTYCGQNQPPEISGQSYGSNICLDTIALGHDLARKDVLVGSARRLEFMSTGEYQVMVSPEFWSPELELLRSDGCYFKAEVFDNPERVIQNTRPFQYLTNVDCPISVINFLLQSKLLPALHYLAISILLEFDDEVEEFCTLADCLCEDDNRSAYPDLRTLNLKFFPPWPRCFRLLSFLTRQPQSRVLILELPALPHPSILQPLVATLGGKSSSSTIGNATRHSYRRYCRIAREKEMGCYYCYASGWACFDRMTGDEEVDNIYTRRAQIRCRRHSIVDPVAVTRYTI